MGMEEEAKGRTIEEYKEQLARDEEQKMLLKSVEALGKKIEIMDGRQREYCDPSSGQCFVTQLALENFLKEQAKKIPQVLGGHQDLSSFFNHLNENPDDPLNASLDTRVPASLKARLVQRWCRDGQCKTILLKEGFEIEDGEKHRGAFPGS